MVVDAAIVGRDVVGIEEDALLYCDCQSIATCSSEYLTSFEAGDRSGHLDSACENVWQRGKCCKQKQSHCRRRSKEADLSPVQRHGIWLEAGQLSGLRAGSRCQLFLVFLAEVEADRSPANHGMRYVASQTSESEYLDDRPCQPHHPQLQASAGSQSAIMLRTALPLSRRAVLQSSRRPITAQSALTVCQTCSCDKTR